MRRERQGAATGLAVSALNHVAHRMSEPKRQSISQSEATLKCERCWWLDNDEYLTFEEAIWHYRLGNGEPVNVKLSKMDLSILKVSDFDNPDFIHQGNPGRYVRLSSINSLVSGNRSEGLVYGTIEVVYIGGNKVMALPNEYDFNMNWEQSIRGFSRDIATFYGGLYNSMGMGGQSYWIQFIGTATIK